MFESAEVGHKLDKAEYEKEVPKLREALLNAQYDLFERGRFQTVVLLAGIGGGGRSETVNRLNEWMDPRHVFTHAFDAANRRRARAPASWRFWRALPPKGKLGDPLRRLVSPSRIMLRVPPDGSTTATCSGCSQEIRHFETHARRRGRAAPQALVPPLARRRSGSA